jgi:hypothetical protein
MLRLILSGAIPPLRLYAFMAPVRTICHSAAATTTTATTTTIIIIIIIIIIISVLHVQDDSIWCQNLY